MIRLQEVILVIAVLSAALVLHLANERRDAEPVAEEPELCEAGTVNPDGSVTYKSDHPGSSELLILQTTNGVKVLAPCK